MEGRGHVSFHICIYIAHIRGASCEAGCEVFSMWCMWTQCVIGCVLTEYILCLPTPAPPCVPTCVKFKSDTVADYIVNQIKDLSGIPGGSPSLTSTAAPPLVGGERNDKGQTFQPPARLTLNLLPKETHNASELKQLCYKHISLVLEVQSWRIWT